MTPTRRLFPSCFGDSSYKPVSLYIRGCDPPFLPNPVVNRHTTRNRHLRAVADAEHRDRHHSSWVHHPHPCAALAWQTKPTSASAHTPSYCTTVGAFAKQWNLSSRPVQAGYLWLTSQTPLKPLGSTSSCAAKEMSDASRQQRRSRSHHPT
eukprot:4347548-Pleurochrysis_carterae.AAC.5